MTEITTNITDHRSEMPLYSTSGRTCEATAK